MSAKQFQHFMRFHQQLADRRRNPPAARTPKAAKVDRASTAAAAAKEWLAGAVRQQPYSPSV
ncbi:MAG: hypothetical protein M9920_07065 [Verrucomicrobiae bacterium]|nr:hypothetical protein [Verrucomicrobiae bacterium]